MCICVYIQIQIYIYIYTYTHVLSCVLSYLSTGGPEEAGAELLLPLVRVLGAPQTCVCHSTTTITTLYEDTYLNIYKPA